MHGQIYRQRRRIIAAGLAAMLAVGWQWQTGLVALAAGAVVVAVSIVIVMGLPGLRRGVECGALGLLFAALLPGPALAILPFWVLLGGVAYYALYGAWADRGSLRLGLVSHRQSQAPFPRQAVWTALIPGESHPDDHWSGTLVDFDRDPDDPETVYLRFQAPTGLIKDMTLTFLTRQPPRSCQYLLEQDCDGVFEETEMTITLDDTADGRTLIATELKSETLLPRIALSRWFDDVFGDELDRFAATLRAKRVWAVHGLRLPHLPALHGQRAKP